MAPQKYMAPQKSIAEGWKYMEKLDGSGKHLKCKLCGHQFCGSLTRVMDHLLSSSNGKGDGVKGCKKVSAKLRQTLENDYDRIKRTKEMNENKKKMDSNRDWNDLQPHFLTYSKQRCKVI